MPFRTKVLLFGALAVAALTSALGVAIAAIGDLTFAQCFDGDAAVGEPACEPTDGLAGADSVVVSPDGRSVYAVSQNADAIVRFDRDAATGAITRAGCVDDTDTAGCGTQAAPGLDGPRSLALSLDGKSVYVASFSDDAIVRFDRDTATGAITPAGCVDDNDTGADGCAQSTDGLNGAGSVVVTVDGTSVYAASADDEAIVRFDRNTTTGAITPAGCVDDNDTGADGCAQSTDGLDGANSVAVSPDGRSVFAASSGDNAIVRFNRATRGAITPVGCVEDGSRGTGECAGSTAGLAGANSVAVSPDGSSVYVASASVFDSDAIVRFDRDTTTGAITGGRCVGDRNTGADFCDGFTEGLDDPSSVTVSPDGSSVYAGSLGDDAIVRFDRDAATGAITPAGCVDDNDTGADGCAQSTDGLDGVRSVAMSACGRSLYSAAEAIVRFDVEVPPPPPPGGESPPPPDGEPPPPPPPDEPPPPGVGQPDTVAPLLVVDARERQRVKGLKVFASCPAEPATVAATGKVRAAGKQFDLRTVSRQVEVNQREELPLKLKRKAQLEKVLDLLERPGAERKAKAAITVTAVDEVGNASSQKRTIKLKG